MENTTEIDINIKLSDYLTGEQKAEWIEALRSGDYEQGVEELYDGNGFCCLGVLRELTGVKTCKGLFGAKFTADIDSEQLKGECLSPYLQGVLVALNDAVNLDEGTTDAAKSLGIENINHGRPADFNDIAAILERCDTLEDLLRAYSEHGKK